MASQSTKERLLSLIDDVELIAKEMFETLIAPKMPKTSTSEHVQLTELLIQKDQEIKAALTLASNQAEIQNKMDALQTEVDKQDQEIRQLQKHLKEAEHILATAIFQAKQKLNAIARANKQAISSEELIKYAHRISASNTVAAPLTWQQGDPRRPYPTDFEMRSGFLSRLSDHPMNGHMLQQQPSLTDSLVAPRSGNSHPEHPAMPHSGSFTWQPSSELAQTLNTITNHNSVHIDTKGHNKENDDVEVMSTDSSSSSSSDSQ